MVQATFFGTGSLLSGSRYPMGTGGSPRLRPLFRAQGNDFEMLGLLSEMDLRQSGAFDSLAAGGRRRRKGPRRSCSSSSD